MNRVLADANILLDVMTDDPQWNAWSAEQLDAFTRLALPWEAGFLAGKGFARCHRAQGSRTSPLPNFYIGAHAAIDGMALLTRDANRFRTYYPTLEVVCP